MEFMQRECSYRSSCAASSRQCPLDHSDAGCGSGGIFGRKEQSQHLVDRHGLHLSLLLSLDNGNLLRLGRLGRTQAQGDNNFVTYALVHCLDHLWRLHFVYRYRKDLPSFLTPRCSHNLQYGPCSLDSNADCVPRPLLVHTLRFRHLNHPEY